MTRSLRLGITAALALVLAGCGQVGQAVPAGTGTVGGAPGSSAASPEAAGSAGTPASQPITPAPVLADGRSPVILKSADVAHGTVTFDLIELYLGTQAGVEWKKDHPGQTDAPALNGHYIRNKNPQLRTLPVAANVVVKVLNGNGDPSAFNVIGFDALPTYRNFHGVFWITVKGGTVTTFEEQFFP
jgi:hypothetical protein